MKSLLLKQTKLATINANWRPAMMTATKQAPQQTRYLLQEKLCVSSNYIYVYYARRPKIDFNFLLTRSIMVLVLEAYATICYLKGLPQNEMTPLILIVDLMPRSEVISIDLGIES